MITIVLVIGFILACIVGVFSGLSRMHDGKDDAWTIAAIEGVGILFLTLIVAWIIGFVSGIYIDYAWYSEIGFVSTWWAGISNWWLMFGVGTLVTFIFFVINYAATGLSHSENKDNTSISVFAWNVIVVTTLIVGVTIAGNWQTLALAQTTQQFGSFDPYHGLDVSFYVFQLPWLRFLQEVISWIVFLTLIGVTGMYFLKHNDGNEAKAVGPSVRHGAFLLALIFTNTSWGLQLDRYSLLLHGNSSTVTGAGFIDINHFMGAFGIMSVIALLVAVMCIVTSITKGWGAAAFGVSGYVLIYIGVLVVTPMLKNYFDIGPNKFAREAPYLQWQIDATRHALNLDQIKAQEYDVQTLTPAEYAQHKDTLSLARVQDYRTLRRTLQSDQLVRSQFEFTDVDLDRYQIGGIEQPVMIAARMLDPGKTINSGDWARAHFAYTHGDGVVAVKANEVVLTGLGGTPSYLVKNIPMSGDKSIATAQQEIYYDELGSSWVVVKSTIPEFNAELVAKEPYHGKGGILITQQNKLLLAFYLNDLNFLLSDYIKPDSRILLRRNMVERAKLALPFVIFDPDPYIVVVDNKLLWVQDGYAGTSNWPQAEATDGFNYIRNPVKVTVDAYDGTVTCYRLGPEPIFDAWTQIYGTQCQTFDQMSAGLKSHLRFPEKMFNIVTHALLKYHMTEAADVYSGVDLWDVAKEHDAQKQTIPMEARYVQMQEPGETHSGFKLIVPFTPNGRQNLFAWLSVGNDPDSYGRFTLLTIPKGKRVTGPEQIDQSIQSYPPLSSQITLLDQRGSTVVPGNLIAIPVTGKDNRHSVIYVKSFYVEADVSGNKIPFVKFVVVANEDIIVYDSDLNGALGKLFAGQGQPIQTDATVTVPATTSDKPIQDLTKDAKSALDAAKACYGKGDYQCWAAEMQKVDAAINAMVNTVNPTPQAPAATPTPKK